MSSTDVVFLVPGFLGFERTGNFSQFGDRVCSTLRAHMEGKLGRQVWVFPLGSLPTTSFADRQRALLDAISRRARALGGIERIHLLGHSVGGIDAHLLGCERPLRGSWQELDPDGLRDKLRSVISLGTPHHGTCLAAAPGAGALTFAALLSDPGGVLAMVQLVQKLFASALHDVGSAGRHGMLREGRKVSHFMAELMRWQGFFHALTPDAMGELYADCEPLPGVVRRSFVTMAARALDVAGSHAPADGFFRELSRRTSGSGNNGFTRHELAVRTAVLRLREALAEGPTRVVVSAHAKAPLHADAQINDGVVNSARQLIDPSDEHELSAVVVADHFDVLGYYDRGLDVAEPGASEPTNDVLSGLLHSGSCFRDSEFFALYRRVGDSILAQCAPKALAAANEPVRPARRTPSRRPTA